MPAVLSVCKEALGIAPVSPFLMFQFLVLTACCVMNPNCKVLLWVKTGKHVQHLQAQYRPEKDKTGSLM